MPLFLILLASVLTLALIVGLTYLTFVLITNTLRSILPVRQILTYFASMIPPSVGRAEVANATTAKEIQKNVESEKIKSAAKNNPSKEIVKTNEPKKND